MTLVASAVLRYRMMIYRSRVDLPSFLMGIITGGAGVLILVCVVIQALGAAIMDGEKLITFILGAIVGALICGLVVIIGLEEK